MRIPYGEKERKELSIVDDKKKIKREQNISRDRALERQLEKELGSQYSLVRDRRGKAKFLQKFYRVLY
jgi:hypothetical protein